MLVALALATALAAWPSSSIRLCVTGELLVASDPASASRQGVGCVSLCIYTQELLTPKMLFWRSLLTPLTPKPDFINDFNMPFGVKGGVSASAFWRQGWRQGLKNRDSLDALTPKPE